MPSSSISEEEVIEVNKIVNGSKSCRYHSIETHNFHITHYGHCLYCEMGSKPVPKVMMLDEVK